MHLSEWAENLAHLSGNTEECGLIVKRVGEVWIGKALVSTSPTPTHTRTHAHTHTHTHSLTHSYRGIFIYIILISSLHLNKFTQ